MTRHDVEALNEFGYCNFFDALPTITPNNINIPGGVLQQISPETIEILTAYRAGDEILGDRKQVTDWETDEYLIPIIENTGGTTPYADMGAPIQSSINYNSQSVKQYRYSTSYTVGNLKASQLSKAKQNLADLALKSSNLALAIEYNRTLFQGYIDNSSKKFICHGILNNPNLGNFKTSAKTFENMTFAEVISFFNKSIAELNIQTGNIIRDDSEIVVAIASGAYQTLIGKVTDLGITAIDTLRKMYPSLRFVLANEFNNAYLNQNVIYFIAHQRENNVSTTCYSTYTVMGQMSNVETRANSIYAELHTGTYGAIINYPMFILRYYGV